METDLGVDPPRVSMIVSIDASIVAAITPTMSCRIPSRVHEARTNPVLRSSRTASRPRSGFTAERKERAAGSIAADDSRPILSLRNPQAMDAIVSPLNKVALRKGIGPERLTRRARKRRPFTPSGSERVRRECGGRGRNLTGQEIVEPEKAHFRDVAVDAIVRWRV